MAVGLLGTGCALNAVLEVRMQLPSSPLGAAFVDVQSGALPCDVPGMCARLDTLEANAESFALSENHCEGEPEPCNVRFSVSTAEVELDALQIRVDLCDSVDCLRTGREPGYVFEIARPFYQGRRTRWSPNQALFADRVQLDPQPAGAEQQRYEAHRCEVEGCISGRQPEDPSLGWCDGPTPECEDVGCRGPHWCEL